MERKGGLSEAKLERSVGFPGAPLPMQQFKRLVPGLSVGTAALGRGGPSISAAAPRSSNSQKAPPLPPPQESIAGMSAAQAAQHAPWLLARAAASPFERRVHSPLIAESNNGAGSRSQTRPSPLRSPPSWLAEPYGGFGSRFGNHDSNCGCCRCSNLGCTSWILREAPSSFGESLKGHR